MKVCVRPVPEAGKIQHYPTRDEDGTIRRWWRAPWPAEDDVDAAEVEALRRSRYLTAAVEKLELPARTPEKMTLPAVETVKLRSVYGRAPAGVGPAALRKLAGELGVPVQDGRIPAADVDRLIEAAGGE